MSRRSYSRPIGGLSVSPNKSSYYLNYGDGRRPRDCRNPTEIARYIEKEIANGGDGYPVKVFIDHRVGTGIVCKVRKRLKEIGRLEDVAFII